MKEVLETLRRYLQNWDPINVIDQLIEKGLPPNEYDSYAGSIYTLLSNGANEEEIYQQLARNLDDMGLKVQEERERKMAHSLYKYFHEKSGFRN